MLRKLGGRIPFFKKVPFPRELPLATVPVLYWFSSLEADKCKNDKTLGAFCSIQFLNKRGRDIESIGVIANIDNAILVNSNNKLYRITSDIEIIQYLKDILSADMKVIG